MSKAICADPLREAPPPCRGLRPHHARTDRVGTWETSPSPAATQAAAGRDGKSRRRSRRGRGEESDGCIVPAKPRTKLVEASGGDGGGKAADRRKGERRRMPRAQYRNRHVTEAASLRIGGVHTRDRVRPSIGARCGKAARRDLCGGTGVTRFPTASCGK